MKRASVTTGMAMLAAVLVTGCSGNDQEQRTAFASFLQTRIVDKPGLHVPQLTDDERAQFGRYAEDYAIITDFNKSMSENVSPKLTAAMTSGSITSLEDIVTRRAQLQAAKTAIDTMAGALDQQVARADAAHRELDQPAELKRVYDAAYDRTVTRPASAFKTIVPVMDTVLGQAIDLGRYLDTHRGAVRISGSTVETRDPATRAAINDRLRSLGSSQQAIQAAQVRMQSVVYGTTR